MPIKITEVVSGTANGVDKLGEQFSKEFDILLTQFPADWSKGKYAGHHRNLEMAKYADACIVIWDGKSSGSANMIQTAVNRRLKLFVFTVI